MADALLEYYHKYAPRWLKVIRWRDFGNRFLRSQKDLVIFGLIPLGFAYYCDANPMAFALWLKKPQNEEELEEIRRYWKANYFNRNWDIDQYEVQFPSMYDMWERRRKYPEHYAGRYDGYKRDGEAVNKKHEGEKNFRPLLWP